MTIIIEPAKQPELMSKLQMISLIGALTMEIGIGMKLSRNINALQVAQRLGFEGSRKAGALKWAVAHMKELDPEYTIPERTAKVLATL